MKIISDFQDYYFRYADGDGPVLVLDSKGGPSKREQFALLDKAGLETPPHGIAEEVLGRYFSREGKYVWTVVVYTDEQTHCGEGKELLDAPKYWEEFDCAKEYLKCYASAYVGDKTKKDLIRPWLNKKESVSWRRLQIGPHCFWIEYSSLTDWRSNVGEGDTKVIGVEWNSKDNPFSEYPIWAVDFVLGQTMYAIDFNVAPGIWRSGVERYLTGREICDILEKHLTNPLPPAKLESS